MCRSRSPPRERSTFSMLVGKPEINRPLLKTRHKLENNIKMCLKELALACEDWMYLSQEGSQWRALEDVVMNLRGSIQ
jgi:hypothetical protein